MNTFSTYKTSNKKLAYLVIGVSTIVRLIVAMNVELGNDEVYYWLYGLYPDISHFDHPPMVGFFIQFFTCNLYFDSAIFIRLAAIIPASFNMFILYKIGVSLKSELAGFINVLLYNISIYGLVISGTFILPDSPLLTFWLLGFYFFYKTLPLNPKDSNKKQLFLAFLFAALAIYSKYQGAYLLLGVLLYITFYNRSWFKEKSLYLFCLMPIVSVFLIFYWNYQNEFISFTFHNDRVSLLSFNFNKDSFIREVLGQIVYSNPVTIFLLIITLRSYFKKKWNVEKKIIRLFIACTFPLIFTVIYLSLYKDTLPHWSGISYITLLPLIGLFLSEKKKYLKTIVITNIIIFGMLILATGIVNKGWFLPKDTKENYQLGNEDFTLDMYGWKQAGEKIAVFYSENPALKELSIISNKWFPAAHIHYYISKSLGKEVYGLGSLKDIHKYYWINKQQPALTSSVLYITDSRNFEDPKKIYGAQYRQQKLLKRISIIRSKKVVKYLFIYQLSNTDN